MTESIGQKIVATHREGGGDLARMLDEISASIDAVIAKKDEAIASAHGALRIADAERAKALALAAERLDGLLAAAAFATVLAKQLRLEGQ